MYKAIEKMLLFALNKYLVFKKSDNKAQHKAALQMLTALQGVPAVQQ